MRSYYEVGGITIYHGDCREFPTLAATKLVLTDPPYGKALRNHGMKNTARDWSLHGDDSDVGQSVIDGFWPTGWPLIVFADPMRPWRGFWRQYLVWDKGGHVGGGGDIKTCWKRTWELIQVANNPPLNGKRDNAVLRFYKDSKHSPHHIAEKPVRLLGYLISKTTQPGDLVYDPFMGSGSTLVAAKERGRRAVGIEIEERLCEIAARRLEQGVLDLGGAA